jgi:SAM-dependent methyltransferase
LGVSDQPYFAWLRGALERFEGESGALATLAKEAEHPEVWVLGGARTNPALELIKEGLGPARTRVRYLDRFEPGPGVIKADFNALEALPEDGCDLIVMSRASFFILWPHAFLAGARRILRPGGIVIMDWIHGGADAPRLDLPGGVRYEDRDHPLVTTYADPIALAAFPAEFDALLAHVNRPPGWVNLERPGAPVPVGERLRRLVGRGPRRQLTRAEYLEALGAELGRAGKHLIGPELMAQYFDVVFRDARYFHALVGKFYLYLLTVLRPVGKTAAESA